MDEVKKVTKLEAMKFLRPALRVLLNLGIGYEVDGWKITIKIPKFIPLRKNNK